MPRQRRVPKQPASINDRLRLYILQHSLSVDFTEFANLGPAFVTEVARVFAMRAGGISKSTTKCNHYTLRLLLGWIQTNSKSFPAFRRKLFTNYQSIMVDEWEVVLNTWRDEIVNGEHRRRETSRAFIIRAANVLIETFVDARIMRPVSRLAPVKHSNKKTTPKKCLAEVSQLPSAIPTEGAPFPCGSGKSPLSDNPSLQDLNESIKGRTEDHIQAIARLNKKRLDDLRRCAERELKQWSKHFGEGQRLLGLCHMSFPEIRTVLHTRYKNNAFRRYALSKLFPKDVPDIALSRYLTYICMSTGGYYPSAAKHVLALFTSTSVKRGRAKKESTRFARTSPRTPRPGMQYG